MKISKGDNNLKKNCQTGGLLLVFLLCLFGFGSSVAFSRDIEMGGLLIDQTKTIVGHSFFRNFSILWEWPEGCDIVIVISEKTNARWHLLQIEAGGLIKNQIIYRKFFGHRSKGEIKKEAEIGVGAVMNYLNLQENQEQEDENKEIY